MNRRSRRLRLVRTMRNAALVLSTLLLASAAIIAACERVASIAAKVKTGG